MFCCGMRKLSLIVSTNKLMWVLLSIVPKMIALKGFSSACIIYNWIIHACFIRCDLTENFPYQHAKHIHKILPTFLFKKYSFFFSKIFCSYLYAIDDSYIRINYIRLFHLYSNLFFITQFSELYEINFENFPMKIIQIFIHRKNFRNFFYCDGYFYTIIA